MKFDSKGVVQVVNASRTVESRISKQLDAANLVENYFPDNPCRDFETI